MTAITAAIAMDITIATGIVTGDTIARTGTAIIGIGAAEMRA
jgi:hypothetical protein